MNIDEQIKQALGEELQDIKSGNDRIDANPFKQMQASLTGRMGWLYVVVMILTVLCALATFYCIYQFYHAQEIKPLIAWGVGITVMALFTQVCKMWHWNELGHNRVIREIKLLELQVARLHEKANR